MPPRRPRRHARAEAASRLAASALALSPSGREQRERDPGQALAALAEFDAGNLREASAAEDRQLPASLVAEASVALWHFVVQREACGLRDIRYVLRDYRVPPEVAARMGALPPQTLRSRKPPRRP